MSEALRYIKDLKSKVGGMTPDAVQAEIQSISEKRIEEIRNTKTDVKITGKSFYVSNDGDDNNDGLSPETPFRTIERVCREESLTFGDGIFFRRGDFFRGTLRTDKEGITLSA